MKIACVGAGPAGLYFAIMMKLRDPKNEITVFERYPAGATHGWGVVYWDDLLTCLDRNDPQSARDIAEHSFRWTGQVVDIRGRPAARDGSSGYGICRRQLLAILAKRAVELGVEIRFQHEITDIGQLPPADLIVASEGVASPIRQHHADKFKSHVDIGRNKYVWLGTEKVFCAFTFGFVPTEFGWIWFHAYAFKKNMSTFIVECSPETWSGLGFDRMQTTDSLKALEKLFAEHLDGHQLVGHARDSQNLPWLNFRNLANEHWHADNVVLIGDAAHTTHFSIGSGTRLAIEDAVALADALGDSKDLSSALKAYESHRQRALIRPQRQARLSAQWFENLPRYMGFDTPNFFTLLQSRRSPLMPHMPAGVYCRLRTMLLRTPGLRKLYRWSAHAAAGLYRLRTQP